MEKRVIMLEDPDIGGSETKNERCALPEDTRRSEPEKSCSDDTTEPEVQHQLKGTFITIGMSMEQIQIKCPAKPITHAFVQFIDNDERDKFVRSANILKKELRGRRIRISPAMDAEERCLGYPNAASTQITTYHSCRST